jgi:hypothetical protein
MIARNSRSPSPGIPIQFDYFLYTSTGSTEWRLDAFASRRVDRIATLLGEGEVQKVIQEAEEKFSKTTNPRAWAIFKNGTPAEQEAFQDEVLRSISEHDDDTSGQPNRQSAAE